MKVAILLLAVALPATYCFYLQPNLHYFPARVSSKHAPVYRSLGNYFQRLHLASKRCDTNLADDSCINGQTNGAASDEDWLNGNGNNPGKRCANTFDESCANGDINGAGSDEDWLNGGSNPGRR